MPYMVNKLNYISHISLTSNPLASLYQKIKHEKTKLFHRNQGQNRKGI